LSGSSPLTCLLAWEALPVAYATASTALRIMWSHKTHHYVKVGTTPGGFRCPERFIFGYSAPLKTNLLNIFFSCWNILWFAWFSGF
jgi:hypothetical protein